MKKFKKLLCLRVACFALLAGGILFSGCKKDDDSEKTNPNNQFAGNWVKDDSGGKVTVVLTENTWTAKYQSSIYNSGTYTYEGSTAQWEITNKGKGNANVGDTGNAAISNSKMIVSNFNDLGMNGQYSKQ